jgi:phage anti-repressor protein
MKSRLKNMTTKRAMKIKEILKRAGYFVHVADTNSVYVEIDGKDYRIADHTKRHQLFGIEKHSFIEDIDTVVCAILREAEEYRYTDALYASTIVYACYELYKFFGIQEDAADMFEIAVEYARSLAILGA